MPATNGLSDRRLLADDRLVGQHVYARARPLGTEYISSCIESRGGEPEPCYAPVFASMLAAAGASRREALAGPSSWAPDGRSAALPPLSECRRLMSLSNSHTGSIGGSGSGTVTSTAFPKAERGVEEDVGL